MDETRAEPPEVEAPPLAIAAGDKFVDEPEEYAVEHHIGAGGMGTVLAARGSKLGRPVALKVITAARDDVLRRFEREAQVTARLQHPAIVPVYGAGRRDGRPFYAMKHVTGEPLDRVIASATTLAQRLALLPKVIAVTEAIAYAHAEGVIHRDLKPANILVGAFGETVVIDWGLARDLRASDDDGAKVIGTPAYMPLEQARGEAVDARADVYALGAILYHVLAGAPPYRRAGEGGVPWETMVARVLAGPPAPLDAAGLPPDLLAIVTRAMAREPGDRYASAGELAEDLRRFQTGQLVGAHRYSTWQLVRRWMRRHRAVLSVAAILGALLVAVGVASIWKILDERDAAESARALAESRRVESDGRRRAAEKLVEYVVVKLHDRLEPIGKLDLLEGVGGEVLAYYESIGKLGDVDDTAALRSRARALDILGSAEWNKGNLDAAISSHRSALALRKRVAAQLPDDHDVAWELSASYQSLGQVEVAKVQLDDALADLRAALAIHEAWMKRRPDDPTRGQIAFDQSYIGRTLEDLDRLGDAESAFRTADAVTAEMVAHAPDNESWQRFRSIALGDLADLELRVGRQSDALAHMRAARDFDLRRVAKHPDVPDAQRDVALTDIQVSNVEQRMGQGDAAEADLHDAIDRLRKVVDHDPANRRWARDLGTAYQHLSILELAVGRADDALASARLELDGTRRLAAADPANVQWQQELAVAFNDVGKALLAKHDVAGALASFRDGVPIIDKVVAANPADLERVRDGILSRFLIADAEALAGHREGALAAYRETERSLQQLLDRDPRNAINLLDVAQAKESEGDLELAMGRRDDAVADYRAALAAVEKLAAQDPSDDGRRADVAEGSFKVASALGVANRAEALPLAQRALAILDDLAARKRIDADRTAMLPQVKKLVDALE